MNTSTAVTPTEIRAFLLHLRTTQTPFRVSTSSPHPEFEDRDWHETQFLADPLRYTLFGVLPDISDQARARIAFITLANDALVSASGAEASAEMEVATAALLCLLPADLALQVFLAVRRERINRKRVSRLACRFLLNHPAAPAFWACRRPAVRDTLEHALGRNVLRACLQIAGADALDAIQWAYLKRNLLRYAQKPALGVQLLAGLATGSEGDATVYRATSEKLRAMFAPPIERPTAITENNRGEVTGALTALYRQTPLPNLSARFSAGLTALAERSPQFPPGFRVALVLDTSASMQGYGDREYCLAASAITLWRLLCRVSSDPIGVFGTSEDSEIIGSLPLLSGSSDLAMALLNALETHPHLVILLSDGYENANAGDLARVIATLAQIPIAPPVLFCSPMFTERDDRAQRQPAPQLPELTFWHEGELPDLLRLAWLHTPEGPEGMTHWIQTTLLARLKGMTTWIQS